MAEWMVRAGTPGELRLDEVAGEVVPGLWVAGMPEPTWPLVGWGFGVVVSLSEHLPPQAARRFEWGTRGGAAGDGELVFVHWPFEDGDLPRLELAELVAAVVVDAVRRGLRVLVHCQEGRNRSGLVAALAARTLAGCSGAVAVAQVRAARPGMLANRRFAAALEALTAP